MASRRLLHCLTASVLLYLASSPCYLAAGGLNLHPPAKHAIVVSDLKMDDTGAIHALADAPETEHVHVVGSNVVNHSAAKGHLDDFMNRMGHQGRYTYYGGERPVTNHRITETHEQHFIDPPSDPVKQSRDVFKNIARHSSVDVYHIAPAHPSTIHALVGDKRVNLKTYHHVQGYNSMVQPRTSAVSDAEASRSFLANIKQKVQSTHPDADVILSSSGHSFTSQTDGATQPLNVLQAKFPANHIKAATMDPFHHRKLHQIEDEIISGHRETAKNFPRLHPSGDASKLTPEAVHSALYGGNHVLRNHLANYVDKALPLVNGRRDVRLTRQVETGVRTALTDRQPRVEMCDAVHVDACLDARRRKDKSAFVPVRIETKPSTASDSVALHPAPAGNSAEHGHMMVNRDASQYGRRLNSRHSR